MKIRFALAMKIGALLAFLATLLILPLVSTAQDRLKSMPGYEQYQKMSKVANGAVKTASAKVTWKDGGKAVQYTKDGKLYVYDIATGKTTEAGKAAEDEQPPAQQGKGGQGKQGGRGKGGEAQGVQRGRQATSATSPNGKHKAFYRDANIWLSDAKGGGNEVKISPDGDEKKRLRYGTGSWVYGEELAQRSAMWWSPDSKKIAYYRFDESKVKDYFLTLNVTGVQDTVNAEPFPKPGTDNPVVDLFIYDVEAKKAVQVDVRDGKPFTNDAVGHYAYHVAWSPDGKEFFFNRTNRRQNIMEFTACDRDTGKCRVIIREEWLPSWTANSPPMRYLRDNKRFIWQSERNGFKNYYLYDLTGKLLATLTNHNFEVANIVRVDETAGLLYYMARSGDNHMKLQLHRVGLDGKGDKRLTDPAFHHTVEIAPDGKHFVDLIQTHDTPPTTRLVDADGKVVAEFAKSDMSRFERAGLKKVELFTYKAGDGTTDLHGMLHFPSNFDPKKKYPLLVTVYGGPNTNKAKETFTLPNATTEYGFLVAELDSRSASGRGKKFLDSIYLKLGVTEIDDQAAGVKSLWSRPYLDKNRVGIFGTSYGGYASAMCLVRYPDVFQAASASSPTSDWRFYDTIYTERYMWIPQENKSGYDAGNPVTYASKLKGRLLIYYGTADNNVHPAHSLALIAALQRANKSFEVQVGPDRGHTAVSQPRMMEFFIENLVVRPATAAP